MRCAIRCSSIDEKNDLSTIDRTPGPKTNNYPAQGTVEDCLIHGIGRVERQPAGVQIAMAMEITVRDTSIYDCARAGINIGDGCWGGHLIERCDVFDTVLETHDHGSFNSWGRDRYWSSDRSASQVEVDADPNLPFLDAMKTTVIRDSRWRCDHGWDIDLDDGSSNYDIYNNLMLQGGLKLREGFRRRAWNNITVNNGFHPHVWYNNSEDEVFSQHLHGVAPRSENAQRDRQRKAGGRQSVLRRRPERSRIGSSSSGGTSIRSPPIRCSSTRPRATSGSRRDRPPSILASRISPWTSSE